MVRIHAMAVCAVLGAATAASAQPQFEVGARAGLSVPFGERMGVPLGDSFDLRPGFQIDVGIRLLRGKLSLLGLVGLQPGTARPGASATVGSVLREQLHVWRFGAQLMVRPLTWEYVEPWGGLALGVEAFMGDAGIFFTPQLGFDFRIYRFRFGPYFELPMGWFVRPAYAGNDFHGWFNVGIKLSFVLGG
jgi:hypothetical protein